MKIHLCVTLLILFVELSKCSSEYRVIAPVCDLRKLPQSGQVNYGYDALELTQLIYNEIVEFIAEEIVDGVSWSFVLATEQMTSIDDKWTPYPGWVLSSQITPAAPQENDSVVQDFIVEANWVPIYSRPCNLVGCVTEDQVTIVPMGTFFKGTVNEFNDWVTVTQPFTQDPAYIIRSAVHSLDEVLALPESQIRSNIINTGKRLLGVYYFWGGRSPFNSDMWSSQSQLTGMDCSGITNLCYRANGLILPRNANDIFWWSKNVTTGPNTLQPGDFLFLCHEDNPNSPYHVMMVAELQSVTGYNDLILESSTNSTRIITAIEKFGVGFSEFTWGGTVRGGLVFWGTAFPYTSKN